MAVQIFEQVVDVLCGSGISIPFLDIEGEKCFIGMVFGLLMDGFQMGFKVDL